MEKFITNLLILYVQRVEKRKCMKRDAQSVVNLYTWLRKLFALIVIGTNFAYVAGIGVFSSA